MNAYWLLLIVPVSSWFGYFICALLSFDGDEPIDYESELHRRKIAMAWARKACTTALSVKADADLYRGVLKQVSMALGDGNPRLRA